MKNYILVVILASTIWGCSQQKSSNKTAPVNQVLTAEEQAKLTPDMVIEILKQGNERFVANQLTTRDHNSQVRKSAKGQYPKAIVLSCVDSRIPVEDVFDLGIGDVFVARVAGNFVNPDILGSMEFATKVAGAKLVFVLGHEHCGAIKAAIDNVDLGNITGLVNRIKPAVAMSQNFSGEKSSKNTNYVQTVCENNVLNTINDIRKGSTILTDLEKSGAIKIIGGVYDMDTGKVTFNK